MNNDNNNQSYETPENCNSKEKQDFMDQIFDQRPSTPEIKRNLDLDVELSCNEAEEYTDNENTSIGKREADSNMLFQDLHNEDYEKHRSESRNSDIDAIASAFKKSWVSCMDDQEGKWDYQTPMKTSAESAGESSNTIASKRGSTEGFAGDSSGNKNTKKDDLENREAAQTPVNKKIKFDGSEAGSAAVSQEVSSSSTFVSPISKKRDESSSPSLSTAEKETEYFYVPTPSVVNNSVTQSTVETFAQSNEDANTKWKQWSFESGNEESKLHNSAKNILNESDHSGSATSINTNDSLKAQSPTQNANKDNATHKPEFSRMGSGNDVSQEGKKDLKVHKAKSQKLSFNNVSYDVHTSTSRRRRSSVKQPDELLTLLQKYQWETANAPSTKLPNSKAKTDSVNLARSLTPESQFSYTSPPNTHRRNKDSLSYFSSSYADGQEHSQDTPQIQMNEDFYMRKIMNPRSSFSSVSINEPHVPILTSNTLQSNIPRQSISSISSFKMSPKLSSASAHEQRLSTFSALPDAEVVGSNSSSPSVSNTTIAKISRKDSGKVRSSDSAFAYNQTKPLLQAMAQPNLETVAPLWCTTFNPKHIDNTICLAKLLLEKLNHTNLLICYNGKISHEDEKHLRYHCGNIDFLQLENVPIRLEVVDNVSINNSICIPELLPFQLYQFYSNQPVVYVPSQVVLTEEFFDNFNEDSSLKSPTTESFSTEDGPNEDKYEKNMIGSHIDNENYIVESLNVLGQAPLMVLKPNEEIFVCLCEFLTCYTEEKYKKILRTENGYDLLSILLANKVKSRF
ncbi:hypothetical protein ACO0QE_001344 [Hanseniaspora vineae]